MGGGANDTRERALTEPGVFQASPSGRAPTRDRAGMSSTGNGEGASGSVSATADFRVGPRNGLQPAGSRNATYREDDAEEFGVGLTPSEPTSPQRGEQT